MKFDQGEACKKTVHREVTQITSGRWGFSTYRIENSVIVYFIQLRIVCKASFLMIKVSMKHLFMC